MISFFKRLFGALSSGNPAARVGILIKLLSPLTNALDYIIPSPKTNEYRLPPVLIITSPPRSGSTVTFQTLTRLLPVRYVSNWHALFPKNASRFMIRNNSFGTGLEGFKNYYGYTASLNDVNEANSFFDTIFDGKPSDDEIRKRFTQFVARISPDQGSVLLKNVRNFPNMAALHKAVPEISFLRIERDLEQNIQSVLRAYYELGGFHPIPEAIKHKDQNNPIEFSVLQILEINAEINKQRDQIKTEQWMDMTYERFCNNTIEIVKTLSKQLNINEQDIRFKEFKEPLKASFKKKVSEEDAIRVKSLLAQCRTNYGF